MRECSCGGANPDCFRCGGLGIYDPVAAIRSSPRRNSGGGRRKEPRTRACPICLQVVPKLIKHIRRQHGIEPILRDDVWTFAHMRQQWLQCPLCGDCLIESDLSEHERRHGRPLFSRKTPVTAPAIPARPARPVSPVAAPPIISVAPPPVPGSRDAMVAYLRGRFRASDRCTHCGETARGGYYCIIADTNRPKLQILRIHPRCLARLPSPYRTLISGPLILYTKPAAKKSNGSRKRKRLKGKNRQRKIVSGGDRPSKSWGQGRVRPVGGTILPAQGQTRKVGSHRDDA